MVKVLTQTRILSAPSEYQLGSRTLRASGSALHLDDGQLSPSLDVAHGEG